MIARRIATVTALLCLVTLTVCAYAVPVVQVDSESVLVRYHIDLTQDNGTVTTLSASDTGSLLGVGASVNLPILLYHNSSDDSNRHIRASASALPRGFNHYDLRADSTDYDHSGFVSSPIYARSSLWAEALVHWSFTVVGGNVPVEAGTLNEYNGCCAITSISLFDLTASAQVINLCCYGHGDVQDGLLIAGHQYALDARSYEFGSDDADTALFFGFDPSAQITGVPGPGSIGLMIVGLALLLLTGKRFPRARPSRLRVVCE